MIDQIIVWRLRQLADECCQGIALAIDPTTRRELAEFEAKFRERAAQLESAHNAVSGAPV